MKTKIVRNQMGEYRLLIKLWWSLGWKKAYHHKEGCGLETKTILTTTCRRLNDDGYFTIVYHEARSYSLATILKMLKDYEEGKEKRVKENTWTEIPEMTVEEGEQFEQCLSEIS